jgi:2-polyprenyl-3-methyl-5-hydroxy-6-metoxy-1,4-benzoquinol methylase
MTKHQAPPRESIADGGQMRPLQRRSPPKAVKVLLPVWGYKFVRNFLEMSLPTLLAPGNLPALATALPTEFVLLTSADDEPYIREHAAIKRLAAVCKVDIRAIDHLITDGNYSTTITLAYTEAVRAVGDAMVDTCFFFLVSDYIVADGSLANALKRMQSGTSAVVVGNFQVTLEDALPWLEEKLLFAKNSLVLQPRELMQWGLNHLHPTALANTINIPFSHNSHTNRLFWRVDGSTMIGRFYLMHMLCVRPEIADFVIGSSCDYSFVPEMCPSGNVEAITDSDQYLVIEMQSRNHESSFLRPGPLKPRDLAKSLTEWTTVVHRDNARHSLVFHADEIPIDIGTSIKQADAFVSRIGSYLGRKPRPYRGHPYWRGAMAAFYEATGHKLNKEDWRFALGLAGNENWLTQWVIWHAKYVVMGRPPQVLPWHPNWPDYRTVLREIDSFFTDPGKRMLMVSNEPTAFTVGLADSGERVIRLRCGPFLQSTYERYEPLFGKFDLCLLELSEGDMAKGDELMDRIVPLMKGGGRIVVFVVNRRDISTAKEFGAGVSYHGSKFVRAGALPTEMRYVPASRFRWAVSRRLAQLRALTAKSPLGLPVAVAGGGLMMVVSLIGNIDVLRRRSRNTQVDLASSFVLRLTVDEHNLDRIRSSSLLEIERKMKARRRELASFGITSTSAAAEQTRESQYNRCVELKDKFGLTSLGLMTNQVWYDDPRRLTFLLARYKFVAKMLSGRRNIGEIGCGDAFGTRVVLQEVPDVTVYDFDKMFIEDIRARYDERWPLKAVLHDIVLGPLPRKHDGLFSLDVLEHIAPVDEHAYLANLRGSLEPDGVLLIGTPSLESQAYASPLSKEGHINCKSGKELKTLLENYFTRVFLFSMNDEVVHTGFSPLAHYLFVMCTGPK